MEAKTTTRSPPLQAENSALRSLQRQPSQSRAHPWEKSACWVKVRRRLPSSELSPAGNELGVLTLITVHNGWNGIAAETTQWLLNENVGSLKAPSAGVLLELRAPVAPEVGDVLAAACVDFWVLPRGYVA